jgi:hypothetical protein
VTPAPPRFKAALRAIAGLAVRFRSRAQGAAVRAAHVATARGRHGDVVAFHASLDVPRESDAAAVRALALTVAERAVAIGSTVGCVSLVPGEEPGLVARAPRLDLVASAYANALLSGESHLAPQLWVTLAAGRYLAEAVDPFTPFIFDEDAVIGLVDAGLVRDALWSVVRRSRRGARIELALYSSLRGVREALRTARRHLAGAAHWESASTVTAKAALPAENARLHR